MSDVSVLVVTAVDAERDQFLTETAASIAAQASSGMQVTWALRVDGARSAEVAARWAAELAGAFDGVDVRVTANGVRRGTAVTRTMAWLSADPHDWVVSIDADDRFAPGAIAALVAGTRAAVSAGHEPGWVSGRAVRFDAAGSSARADMIDAGPVASGELLALVERSGCWAPVPPNTLLVAGHLLERFAGWPAVVSCEDLGLLYRVAAVSSGWRIDDVVLERRLWPGQVTAVADWHQRARVECFTAAIRLAAAG